MRNAADMTPVVSYTTLRSRYLKRETAPTTFGPMPMLGLDVETAIVNFFEQQYARGSKSPRFSSSRWLFAAQLWDFPLI